MQSRGAPQPAQGAVLVISQVAIVYAVCLLWFLHGVIGLWEDVVQRTQYSRLLLDAGTLRRGPTGHARNWFAVTAAATHAVLVVVGIRAGHFAQCTYRPVTASAAVVVLFFIWCWVWLQTSFESGTGVVHAMGALFFRSSDGSVVFATSGAVAMSAWLACSMAFSFCDRRLSGIIPAAVAAYLPPAVGCFSLAAVFFPLCVPLWNGAVRHCLWAAGWLPSPPPEVPADGVWLLPFSALAACSHTVCVACGVLTASVAHRALGRWRRGYAQRPPPLSCGPQPGVRRWPEHWAPPASDWLVLAVLCSFFAVAASAWVAFALRARVEHVWGVARAFIGSASDPGNVGIGSAAHVLITGSYLLWFAGGVLFEQHWRGSMTNARRASCAQPAGQQRAQLRRGCGGGIWPLVLCGFIASATAISELRRAGGSTQHHSGRQAVAVLCDYDGPCPALPKAF